MFKPNWTLDKAVGAAMLAVGHGLGERVGIRARMALLPRAKREELEKQVTAAAVAASAIPPSSVVGGIYVGNWWQDLLQFLIDNWEVILEIILAIITIFLDRKSVV